MSTPDQPSTPPLTRRQLRELRNTGATPVVPVPAADGAEGTERAGDATGTNAPADSPEAAPAAPLARAAEPVSVRTAPVPDAAVDLGAAPLTRRQARQQERIRTASVPVISTEPATRPGAAGAGRPNAPVTVIDPSPWAPAQASATTQNPDTEAEEAPGSEAGPDEPAGEATPGATETNRTAEGDATAERTGSAAGWTSAGDAEGNGDRSAPSTERAVVNPMFGAGLLAGETEAGERAPSFEQLLTRDLDTTGSVAASSALIMSHASAAPLVGPIGGTGEVLVTGTFALPEGLGSTGHVKGTADGREVDAVLVDGELPAHSSPTPIAASAAVSTIKSSQDIIQPPAPEKGGKLMLALAITAGVLALALVGVLVYALASGVIS